MSASAGVLAETIAEHLSESSVYVDPAAASRIPDVTLEQVTAKAEALPYDTYVLIVGDDVDRSDLGELVHERTGQDGLYLVASPRGTLDAHIAHDGSEALDGVREVISAHQGPGTGYEGVRLLVETLDELGAEGAVPDADTDADLGAGADAGADSPGETGSTGTSIQEEPGAGGAPLGGLSPDVLILLLLIVGIAAAFIGTRLLNAGLRKRTLARRQRFSRIPADLLLSAARMQRQSIRRTLAEDTLHLSADLVALDTDDLTEEQAGLVRHGMDAYTYAGRLVDAEDATRADLAGVLVLLTIVADDLAQVQGADPQERDSLCSVDPTHGQARARRVHERGDAYGAAGAGSEAGIVIGAGAGTESGTGAGAVGSAGRGSPVCARCDDDLAAGRRPRWLLDRGKPYSERDTVWARTRFGTGGGDLVELVKDELAARR